MISEVLPWTKSYLSWGHCLPWKRGAGTFPEQWRIITCLLLRICTLVPGWSTGAAICCQEPVCSRMQPLRTNLQSMFCMSKPRSLWISLPPVFSWQLPFQAIKKEKKSWKQFSEKGRLCFYCRSSNYGSNAGETKFRRIKARQPSVLYHVCLLQINFYFLKKSSP